MLCRRRHRPRRDPVEFPLYPGLYRSGRHHYSLERLHHRLQPQRLRRYQQRLAWKIRTKVRASMKETMIQILPLASHTRMRSSLTQGNLAWTTTRRLSHQFNLLQCLHQAIEPQHHHRPRRQLKHQGVGLRSMFLKRPHLQSRKGMCPLPMMRMSLKSTEDIKILLVPLRHLH